VPESLSAVRDGLARRVLVEVNEHDRVRRAGSSDLVLHCREHLLGCKSCRCIAVGGRGRVDRALGRVFHAGVEPDDGYLSLDSLVQLVHDGVRVEGRKTDGRRILRHVIHEHLHLGLDVGFGWRPFERDFNAVLLCCGLCTKLDRLPELVLEPLGNDGNVDLRWLATCQGEDESRRQEQHPDSSIESHRYLLWYLPATCAASGSKPLRVPQSSRIPRYGCRSFSSCCASSLRLSISENS